MPSVSPLRPPGAVEEGEFLRRCVQCGRCAQVCPYGSVTMEWSLDVRTLGAPVIRPRLVPCWLCMRCPPVCPTGALRPVSERAQARMGLAVLDRKRCLTYEGSVFCKTCHEKCPLRGRAIEMEMGLFPVITSQCVGCGVCENVCPVQAIVTLPQSCLPSGHGGEDPS